MAKTRILWRWLPAYVMLGVVVAACSKGIDNHDHPGLTTGEQLFNYHCVVCHADDGTGRLVDGTPANILTAKNMQGIMDYIISDTGQGRKMPVFATMPRAEAAKIAAYLIQLKSRYEHQGENERKNRGLLIEPE